MAIAGVFFFFFFFFMLVSMTLESSAQTGNNGFSVEIIPYDSPSSPFYDPSATASTRVRRSVQRSHSRFQYLQSSLIAASRNDLLPPVTSNAGGGIYLMKLLLGSPTVEIFAMIDTGSDLIWTQCLPCGNCFPQPTPMFDPAKSSSYINLGCGSSFCKTQKDQPITSCDGGACHFVITYADQTKIIGVLANDTMALDSSDGTFSFPVIFGCGHDDTTSTLTSQVGGIVGLGRGPLSLVSQLGSVALGRFSYCLTDAGDTASKSVMNFGLRAEVFGKDLVTTPITTVPGGESHYYLTLDDISVGSQKLNIPPGTFHASSNGQGGLVIDSGASMTYLNKVGYDMTLSALKSVINFPVAANHASQFQLCYEASMDDVIHSFPDVTFHFLGGDVIVGAGNIFAEVDQHACLTIFPSNLGVSLYGNNVQQNFHIAYDLEHQTVSFVHADCKI